MLWYYGYLAKVANQLATPSVVQSRVRPITNNTSHKHTRRRMAAWIAAACTYSSCRLPPSLAHARMLR